MPEDVSLDEKDHEILGLLRENGRQPTTDIAPAVKLSAAAVRRRIDRLERIGVIKGYTVVLDHNKVAPSVEAYVELTFSGNFNLEAMLGEIVKAREVREASMLAGDPDAMVRLRVPDLEGLRQAVIGLRQIPGVMQSKTMVALGRTRHVAIAQSDRAKRTVSD
jgi:Lrp/AsnC family leucine-responsive transcriptional regulator